VATNVLRLDCGSAPNEGIEAFVSHHRWIAGSAPLIEAVETFRTAPELRLLAVLDADFRPMGAIFERDMRNILFNPFGYALLRNPSFGGALDQHVRPCPIAEIGASLDEILDVHARHQAGSDGLVLTRNGAFAGVLSDQVLLRLASARQVEAALQRAHRIERVEQASTAFEDDAERLGKDLSGLSRALAATADRMVERAQGTQVHAANVAGAATQASSNMEEIAERAHRLAGTLHKVEQKSGDASRAARDAVALAGEGGVRMRRLAQSAGEIVEVTDLIDTIARRTKMLAINASIEAARAGEAGRGFTVVAGEVKSLAVQTRTAAATIRDRVRHIGEAITDVAVSQEGIEKVIHAAEAVSASLFEAMQDQRVATEGIAIHLEEAGKANEEIERNAARINATAGAAAKAAETMRGAAAGLSDQGAAIERRLGEFLEVVRTS
jgi:methyl-accepting chemotaxis protein